MPLAPHLNPWPLITLWANEAHKSKGLRFITNHRETRIISNIILFITVLGSSKLGFCHLLHENRNTIILRLGKKNQIVATKTLSPQVAVIFTWVCARVHFTFDLKIHTQFWHETYDSDLYSTSPVKTDDSATSYNSRLLQYSSRHALCRLERAFKWMRQKQQCPHKTYAVL